MASINDLMDDVLLIIFWNLSCSDDRHSFGLTCHRWLRLQNIARRSLSLEFSYDIHVYQQYIRYLPRLVSRFPNLRSVVLAGCAELQDSSLLHLRLIGQTLRSLSLQCCFGITDAGIVNMSAGCPHLISVTLYRSNVTDVGIKALAESCPGLESVNLSHCTLISDAGIGALSRGCPGIRAMVLSSCRGVTGTGFRGCSSSLVFVEADSCPLTPEGVLGIVSGGGLEYLNVTGLRSWVGGDGLDGLGGGLARNLRFLNLRACRFVGNESVSAISGGCPNLEEWNLALCHEVRTPGWVAIGSNCENLRALHVSRCRNLCDLGLQSIGEGCVRLTSLYMHGCRMVTDIGMESFRRRRPEVEVRRKEYCCIGPSPDEYFLW
ncbi:F-box/LRR-repeat protein 12 [Acorus gramineus]|uniref:F-box/LRR-repeat protein 12 n=1 Tax=Acorus gramineus TaxID=55184 RepID=A0AAV9API7_ACOGR|nr:F-box/LRR-repeat protein 12 [Acorus gramineus]